MYIGSNEYYFLLQVTTVLYLNYQTPWNHNIFFSVFLSANLNTKYLNVLTIYQPALQVTALLQTSLLSTHIFAKWDLCIQYIVSNHLFDTWKDQFMLCICTVWRKKAAFLLALKSRRYWLTWRTNHLHLLVQETGLEATRYCLFQVLLR